jgi:hypothetical protein
MYVFKTRYADMTFEGIPAKGPSLKATAFTIRTNDDEIAKALRTRKDVWEMTTKEVVEEAKAEAISPKRSPGRPKTVRGSRTVAETQGE